MNEVTMIGVDLAKSVFQAHGATFGTSTVFDNPLIADGLAWQQFEKTVKGEGLTAFLSKKEKRQLFH